MSLSDLPREILLDIADHLNVKGTIALARTNSGLYQLLIKQIYRQDVAKSNSVSLAWAAEKGVVCTAQRALDASRGFNSIPESFHKALQIAAYRGQTQVVEFLLGVNGINSNFVNVVPAYPFYLKSPPLIHAVERGHSPIVELLLSTDNIDPNLEEDCAFTPLVTACLGGDVSIVRQFLARDDIDFNRLNSGLTPLLAACSKGRKEVVKLLLERYDVDVNLGGETAPLLEAVEKMKSAEVVKCFLSRADLDLNNVVNSHGQNVLKYSASIGHTEIVKLLLDHPNIDVNHQGGYERRTALIIASEASELDVVKLLLEKEGIEVNRQDRYGWTALCEAIWRGRSEIAKLLLEREDIDINLPNQSGGTPLLWSIISRESCPGLLDLLLEKDGIDPNPRGRDGITPLAHICKSGGPGSLATVRSLLSHPDTDPNAVDNNGVSVFAHFMKTRGYTAHCCEADEIELLLRAAGAS